MESIEKIEINGHHVWVDIDAEIKEGDWYKSPAGIYSQHNGTEKLPDGWCKIIAASPELNLDVPTYVEWLFENQKIELNGGNLIQIIKDIFIKGYQTRDKELPTWDDVREAIRLSRRMHDIEAVLDNIAKYTSEDIIEQLKQDKI